MSKPQSEIYDSLAKLEIYLFTRPVRGHIGVPAPGSWIGGGVFVPLEGGRYLKVMKIYNMAAHRWPIPFW